MGEQVSSFQWPSIKRWLSKLRKKRPPYSAPRELCEHHHLGCYICPETRCIGALNDQHDPDLMKPRLPSFGYCIHAGTGEEPIILRVSAKGANAHFTRLSVEKRTPVYLSREASPEAVEVVESYAAARSRPVSFQDFLTAPVSHSGVEIKDFGKQDRR